MQDKTTKHAALQAWIFEKIKNGTFREGEKLISENELCAMFGVSRHTVRHALDTLESEGYLDRRRGSGTYVRSKNVPKRQPTKNIGVILSYFDDYIFPGILKGIDTVLSKRGYNIMLGVTYNKVENERRLLEDYLQKGVDGIIVEAAKSALPNPNLDLYHQLRQQQIPAVFVNCYYKELGGSHVTVDDGRGAYLAAQSLVRAGHRHIGGIFKSDDAQGKERYAGYVKALHDNHLTIPEDSVQWYSTEDMKSLFGGDYDKVLLKRFEGCTGVVCYNDQVAYKLVELLQRNGISVPDDISVTGFDNSSLAMICSVRLTTVTHPGERLGERAAAMLYAMIVGQPDDKSYVFIPELIERDSVKDLQ